MSQRKVIHRAATIIERDAVMGMLIDAGLKPFTPEQNIVVKNTDTVDLTMDWHSAMFSGYAIEVDSLHEETAKALVKKFVFSVDNDAQDGPSPILYWKKFYWCCLFSTTVPVILHGLAIYHMVKAIQNGQKTSPFAFILGACLWLVGIMFILFILSEKLSF
jgi:hypothetical protein